jgi:hypothetical protein
MRQLDKDMLALSMFFESLGVTTEVFMFFFPTILIWTTHVNLESLFAYSQYRMR